MLPRTTGLPNWRVIAWFPVLLAVVFIVLVSLQISGTSSGVHWMLLEHGTDPRLIYGTPRTIRSDEFLTQQSWLIAQARHNFPTVNPIFPGGVDMTVLNELPSWDLSSLFRADVWGHLLLGVNYGVAWEWWLPTIGMISGCYVFMVTISPRRPITAALISIALFFMPFVQWWFGPSTMWPIGWSLFAMAGFIWQLREPRRWVRRLFAGIVGYFAVSMAMGLYVPFMIPGLVVFVFFAVGYLVREKPWAHGGLRATTSALLPYVVAGVAAAVITATWAFAHLSTFNALFSAVYPGQRAEPTGNLLSTDPNLTSFAGAAWNGALKVNTDGSVLGPNASEASTVILLSLFLLPALIWFLIAQWRKSRTIDWVLLFSIAVFLVVVAYLVVPGWDPLAHLLQLDRVPARRFKIVFAVLLPLFAALTIEQVDKTTFAKSWKIGVVCGGVAIAVMGGVLLIIRRLDPATLVNASNWKIVVVAIVLATVLLFAKRTILIAAVMLLIASLLIGWNVNPIYRGVFDLSDTTTGRLVAQTQRAQPGSWVAVGSGEAAAILVQSGVRTYSGVQNYPSRSMWAQIDPTSRYEKKWNRLAHLNWAFRPGEPKVSLVQEDLIEITFDPCSAFAQRHLDYVLSDSGPVTSQCLRQLSSTEQGTLSVQIYQVVPAPAAP